MADVKELRKALCLTESGYNMAICPIAEIASKHAGEFAAFSHDVLGVKELDELVMPDGDSKTARSMRRLLRDLVLVGIARVNMRVLRQRLDEAEATEATNQ